MDRITSYNVCYTKLLRILVFLPFITTGQPAAEEFVSNCVLAAGNNTTYLKDFRVQLPKAGPDATAPVYKANMYLMKNIKYRFSVCETPESAGELIITISYNFV